MPASLQIFDWGLSYYATILNHPVITVAGLLLLEATMPVMSITPVPTTVMLATAVVATAVVAAQ
ncbi:MULTISPECIES: hypothetical protein [Pseudomonas]|uniref:Uncharacterized protein n=1 Tax=Pseudomonas juntendi TaxID=2666183 RepID=A0AAJ5SCW8_9PSED|nr:MULTISPECIES: hypothetical protein [Pseudomonas]MCP3791785.1 hypothetical protein [Pseudomonas sp. N2-11]KGK28268.1 hypothetical protein GT93_26575 [Pseudomonas plecoglossicida]MCX2817494.1 hypothetical protein [Pseudomonas sp. DCB_E]MCX9145126.1 hypothetical protein [Pseudomonas sp. DCB_Q]MEB3438185.1 hypothetical protein [Pseudomonas sp. A2]